MTPESSKLWSCKRSRLQKAPLSDAPHSCYRKLMKTKALAARRVIKDNTQLFFNLMPLCQRFLKEQAAPSERAVGSRRAEGAPAGSPKPRQSHTGVCVSSTGPSLWPRISSGIRHSPTQLAFTAYMMLVGATSV